MNSQKQQILELVHSRFDEAKARNFSFVNYIKAFCRGRKLCLFGAGGIGLSTYYRLKGKGLPVALFCDNNPQKIGTEIVDGIRCVSAEELLANHKDCCTIITAAESDVILHQLNEAGFTKIIHYIAPTIAFYGEVLAVTSAEYLINNIKKLLDILHDKKSLQIAHRILAHTFMAMEGQTTGFEFDDIYSPNQYLPDDIHILRNPAIYIDCGAYDGDTLKYLFSSSKWQEISQYYGYELDSYNYEKFLSNLSSLPEDIQKKVIHKNLGVGEKHTIVRYEHNNADTFASASGQSTGTIVTLDEDLNNVNVGCIKMDIEGAEIYALQGASSTIKKYTPSLAICTYHTLEHLWEIPLYIKSLVPAYNIRFRHHTKSVFETVCYATVE